MNNPNPFVPQGSLLEQQSKRRSRLKLAVFCVLAVGVAGLSAMLIQGCKREQTESTDNTSSMDTNPPAIADTTDTNQPPMDTNPPVVAAPPVAPTPPPVVTPPPVETSGTEYVVIKGDTLGKIARKNGVKLKALEDANPGVVPTKLKVGQKLTIPAATSVAPESTTATDTTGVSGGEEVYTVKSGDTLTRIAKANGTTVKAIESENNLTTTKIKVGQKLKIPASAETAAPAPAPAPAAPVMPAPVVTPSTTSTN